MGFPDQITFDVHAFVDNKLAEEKPATKKLVKSNTFDSSIEQIESRTITGQAGLDHELKHIWAEVKKALRNQLKEELRTELQNELKEELKSEVRREQQDELLQQEKEAQMMVEMEEAVTIQQHTKRELFDPFAPVALGPIKPGFEDGDARAIAELDDAMKEVDERMARMDEEREKGFEEERRG